MCYIWIKGLLHLTVTMATHHIFKMLNGYHDIVFHVHLARSRKKTRTCACWEGARQIVTDRSWNGAVKWQELVSCTTQRESEESLPQAGDHSRHSRAEETQSRPCSHTDTACMIREQDERTHTPRDSGPADGWETDMETERATALLPDSHAKLVESLHSALWPPKKLNTK